MYFLWFYGVIQSWICNANQQQADTNRTRRLQCPCIYKIELDFHLRENATKEMQDAIDSAEMNGKVKIF